ncbi:MAG: TetR family transcriptional regulator [Rhodospirillaceae bacterium]|nr:TetR family transcriptional regulator [Rhodospirillaceae bacterium]
MTTKNAKSRRAHPAKRQRRTELTRSTVLGAALHEFAQHGLHGTRVDRIAARAGVNKQALYYHYGSKEELFRATLASVYGNSAPIHSHWSVPDLPPELAMRWLITTLFEHFRRLEDGTSVITHENRYHGKHLTPKIRQQIRAAVSPIIKAIADVLGRGQREGVFSKNVKANDLYLTLIAESMFYFSHAYTLSAILEYDLLDDAAVKAWKTHVEDFVLAALKPRD